MITLRVLGGLNLAGLDTTEARTVLRQPKRMALLTYLSLASREGFERRDRMLAMFWPEMDEARARRGLRQSLHILRGALGPDAFERRGDDEIALNPAVFGCDAIDVEALLDEGRLADAVELYRGDLLPGFHLDEVPQFERWLEETRSRLRARVADAALLLSDTAEASGDIIAAASWARRALDLATDNERTLRRLIALLSRAGDRTGALRAYADFARRLREDLDIEPTPETQALVSSLRLQNGNGNGAHAAVPAAAVVHPSPGFVPSIPAPSISAHIAEQPAGARSFAARHWWQISLMAAATIAIVALPAIRNRAEVLPPEQGSRIALGNRARAELLYAEGMRAATQGDRRAAERLMRVAVAADSTLALARLQLGHLMGLRGEHATAQRLQSEAVALAPTQSDHDRLLILALYADHFQQPSLSVVAETLAIRYPEDLEGQLLVAKARRSEGAFLTAIAPLKRLISLARDPADSAARCLQCEAYYLLTVNYEVTDSAAAAERTARAWTRARPSDADAWAMLGYQLATMDRYQEALAALHRAEDLRPGATGGGAVGEVMLRAGDFRTLHDILQHRIRTGNTDEVDDARFLLWRTFREQGRRREALALALSVDQDARKRPGLQTIAAYMRAQSLLEADRPVEAAFIWDSVNAIRPGAAEPRASVAAAQASRLAHLSAAVAGLGDGVRLGRLSDSVRMLGALSGSERTRRLHHFVRGQQMALLGRDDEACTALQESLFQATATFVRANLAAGRACLKSNRGGDALRAVRGVLRGPIGAGGTFGTLTEAHDIAARAFEILGQRDSARVHYQRVADAWKDADSPERERARSATRSIAGFAGGTR